MKIGILKSGNYALQEKYKSSKSSQNPTIDPLIDKSKNGEKNKSSSEFLMIYIITTILKRRIP
jgi:hypothetical protein